MTTEQHERDTYEERLLSELRAMSPSARGAAPSPSSAAAACRRWRWPVWLPLRSPAGWSSPRAATPPALPTPSSRKETVR